MRELMQLEKDRRNFVTGSDSALGGHAAENVHAADLVVYTCAVGEENIELKEARRLGIPTVERAELLGQLAATYSSVVAIAGAHGKTTATGMTAAAMRSYMPTVHIGGDMNPFEGECKMRVKDCFITEACEYKRNFLHLSPRISVVLNVELDHTDYYRDLDDITSAFSVFSHSAPLRVVCADDAAAAPLRDGAYTGFGIDTPCEFRAADIVYGREGARFTLLRAGKPLGEIRLRVMGRHNVYNALAAAAAAFCAGLDFAAVKRGLENFTGVKRRQEYLCTYAGCDVFSDYAHHPREIESTLSCLREAGYGRIGVAFEPHTYTRTQSLCGAFCSALRKFDDILLSDIYAAREDPIAGVSSGMLCRSIMDAGGTARCFATFFELNEAAERCMRKDAAFVYCGAGTIDAAARSFCENNA